jgi:hypothetical protein
MSICVLSVMCIRWNQTSWWFQVMKEVQVHRTLSCFRNKLSSCRGEHGDFQVFWWKVLRVRQTCLMFRIVDYMVHWVLSNMKGIPGTQNALEISISLHQSTRWYILWMPAEPDARSRPRMPTSRNISGDGGRSTWACLWSLEQHDDLQT